LRGLGNVKGSLGDVKFGWLRERRRWAIFNLYFSYKSVSSPPSELINHKKPGKKKTNSSSRFGLI
jgi:hypothetical protein